MTATSTPYPRPLRTSRSRTRRLLGSPLVDLLVGPHGIDRYLELIRPEMTVGEARARIVAVERQTPRSVTLRIRPNAAWDGFRAGQFVRVGVEIGGVRRTRTYSPASSEHQARRLLELTISFRPDGLVSGYLRRENPGGVVYLGAAEGSFVLPDERPERLVLVSGGSGITPVLSMLRTLCDEGHDGQIEFIHYARTRADWLYRAELETLAERHRNLTLRYVATREGGSRLDRADLKGADLVAVCGPPGLIEAAHAHASGEVISETFTAPSLSVTGAAATGTLRFTRSGSEAAIGEGTLLEQAEAAGLSPEFGCRMGICHTCTCRKTAGAVQNLLTGEVSEEEDEDIQLCVSVPRGDVALQI
jgi:ferredoxin-NADP reductase